MNKKGVYFALSGLETRDELYYLSATKQKQHVNYFGFDVAKEGADDKETHEESLNWIRKNAKFLGNCVCVAY